VTQEKSSAVRYQEQLKRDRDEIQRRTGRTPEELYEERETRVRDAIQLKEPDRVPWVMVGGEETNVLPSASYYDPAAHREEYMKADETLRPASMMRPRPSNY
jgi:hypothetical protein